MLYGEWGQSLLVEVDGLKSGAILANEFGETFFFNSSGTKTLL